MQVRDTSISYGATSILLHWISAALVAATYILGEIAHDAPRGAQKAEMMDIHQSLGMLLLMVVLARLSWRLHQGFPEPAGETGDLTAKLVKAWHWLLLGLIVAIPATGYLAADAGSRGLTFFGMTSLPDLLAADQEVNDVLGEVHETLSGLVIPLVALHVLAALKHHYFDRDNTLNRMTGLGAGH